MAKNESKRKDIPDGGWGWICVIGSFMMHVLHIGTERLYGLIYNDVIERFEERAAAVAGVGGICTALRMCLAPVSSYLCNRFSVRKVSICGGVLVSLGVLLSAYAPSVLFLFFSWGVLLGVGGALVYTPSLIILSMYFHRRLPIANGISTSGSGLGLLCMSLLYPALMSVYGFTGALTVVSGVALNTVCCAALFRTYRKPVTIVEEDVMLNAIEVMENEPANEDDQKDETTESAKTTARKKTNHTLDIRLFTNVRYVCYIICCGVLSIGIMPVITFLPARMIERGFTRYQTSYAFSMLGIPDTAGRLICGATFSFVPFFRERRRQCFVVILAAIAIELSVLPNLSSLASFYVVIIFYGLSMGSCIALLPTLLADWIRHSDPERDTASGLGFMVAARGIGTIVGPVVGGLLKDWTGHYDATFYFLSGMLYLSVALYSGLLVLDWLMTRKNK